MEAHMARTATAERPNSKQTLPPARAIANAVYHATGVRVRELPITLDKVLG
jgi:hypothetical protein